MTRTVSFVDAGVEGVPSGTGAVNASPCAACGLELGFSLANYDDSYDYFIEQRLQLDPERRLDQALAEDEVVRSALPGRLYDVYMHYKRDEWEQFLAAVTDWERERYLDVLP